MTSVNGASRAPQPPARAPDRAPPAQQPSYDRQPPQVAARTDPDAARAMKEALDAARGRMGQPPAQGTKGDAKGEFAQAKKGAQLAAGREGREAGQLPAQAGAAGRQQEETKLRSKQDGAEALAGWGGQGAGAAAAQAAAVQPPPPHVDASAFAQVLADLWTRENGRGHKEVRVRFGDRAWPATGARLVRNAAGTLDVALLVGDGGRAYGDAPPGLAAALSAAGVDVGSLVVEADG